MLLTHGAFTLDMSQQAMKSLEHPSMEYVLIKGEVARLAFIDSARGVPRDDRWETSVGLQSGPYRTSRVLRSWFGNPGSFGDPGAKVQEAVPSLEEGELEALVGAVRSWRRLISSTRAGIDSRAAMARFPASFLICGV